MTGRMFEGISPVRFAGETSRDPLAYRFYDPARVVGGKPLGKCLTQRLRKHEQG